MKKILRVLSPLFLAIPLLISCDKRQDEPINPSDETESGLTIDMSADLEDLSRLAIISSETGKPLSKSEARVFIANNGTGNGINFKYREGEKLNAVFFFKRGGQTAKWETQLTIKQKDDAPNQYEVARTTIQIPSNIANASGLLDISAAIGVVPTNHNNIVRVPNPEELFYHKNIRNYNIPMYFPRVRVDLQKQNLFKTRFQVYGAVVAFTATNANDTKYPLKELDLKTEAFDTEGEMNLDTDSSPIWVDTQDDNNKKTISLINLKATTKQISPKITQQVITNDVIIPANSEKTFFFWVKPSANGAGKNLEIGLKSFSTNDKPSWLDAGLPDQSYRVPVKKNLQEGLVHRMQVIPAPKAGGLIITEVFRGAGTRNTAIELYNSSDQPIHLGDYQIRSYGDGQLSTSELLSPDDWDFRVMVDNTTGYHKLTEGGSKRASYSEVNSKHYTLKPKHMAIFLSQSVVINIPYMTKRPNLSFVFNLKTGQERFRGYRIYPHGYIELIKKNTGEVVDVFLKMNEAGGQQTHNVVSYTMMRKPDRNAPRKIMTQGSNSDWISRYRTESMDWGYRFGFEYGPRPNSDNNIWFDLANYDRGNAELETVAGKRYRSLTYLNTDPTNAGFLHSWEDGARQFYTVPKNWTRANGTAH